MMCRDDFELRKKEILFFLGGGLNVRSVTRSVRFDATLRLAVSRLGECDVG